MAVFSRAYRHLMGVILCLVGFSLVGCNVIQVATYDPSSFQLMQQIDRSIDKLYLSMSAKPQDHRNYSQFASQYLDIQVQIRSLVRLQMFRKNNSETLKQSQILENLWQSGRQEHQSKGTLSNVIIRLRQSQYQRMLSTLMKGESLKPHQGA
ncbi:hypothetical protein [Celerinatantimonas sp. YJH-8]|uniref:hypothetical protein n=1 Tax=Celerinatantimonas sp. YJH-8 TaxID=3228714 RepID=UPI0038C56C42